MKKKNTISMTKIEARILYELGVVLKNQKAITEFLVKDKPHIELLQMNETFFNELEKKNGWGAEE